MNKRFLFSIVVALVVAPFAVAHEPRGTPKNYCEPGWETSVHEYGPPATGVLIYGDEDGNLLADCSGMGIVGDWDGHTEFALGGARILAGWEALDCYGAEPHHDAYGPFTVDDLLLGYGATFTVASDTVDLLGGSAGPCGDFEEDMSTDCVGTCTVTFPPGLDGAYLIYVQGTQGHVIASGGGGAGSVARGGPLTLASGGGMAFANAGGAPSVEAAPGWDCEGPFFSGSVWEIQCSPFLLAARADAILCINPYAIAGGTAVSFGTASVSTSCADGNSTGCTTNWVGTGSCLASPTGGGGGYPLSCRASVTGTSIGGTLYASCGTMG